MNLLKVQTLHPRRIAQRSLTTWPQIFHLPPGGMAWDGTGAGVMTFASTVAAYAMPETINSAARGVIPLPPTWAGKPAKLMAAWFPADANAGNVSWSSAIVRIQNDLTIAVLQSKTAVDAASGSATKFVVTQIDFGALPTDIVENEFLQVAIRRRGDVPATDTYANHIYLIGVAFGLR